ncbi:hypothetical protein EYF80_006646 [Liparis tanakae]|uniref:Uncharacterized protein n=1 Tax=Liparis tanakae TaxID=230148 RepID=A0A4Z2IYI0_9TELE|nr:hypothetical protein EYF80_006646 [Liparis tanakae]
MAAIGFWPKQATRDSSFTPPEIPRDPSTAFPVFRLLDIGMRVSPVRGIGTICFSGVTLNTARPTVISWGSGEEDASDTIAVLTVIIEKGIPGAEEGAWLLSGDLALDIVVMGIQDFFSLPDEGQRSTPLFSVGFFAHFCLRLFMMTCFRKFSNSVITLELPDSPLPIFSLSSCNSSSDFLKATLLSSSSSTLYRLPMLLMLILISGSNKINAKQIECKAKVGEVVALVHVVVVFAFLRVQLVDSAAVALFGEQQLTQHPTALQLSDSKYTGNELYMLWCNIYNTSAAIIC